MTKKQLLRSIAFVLVLAMLLLLLCDMFELGNVTNASKRFATYRALENDTVDAVLLGTSGIDRYWISSLGYEDYGITAYPLATDAFPAWLVVPALKDALSYQDPELIILDIRPFTQENEDAEQMDVRARRVLDVSSPFSRHRITMAMKTMEMVHRKDDSLPKFDISYFFSVVRYHQMWEEDDYSLSENLTTKKHEYCGFFVSNNYSTDVTPLKSFTYKPDLIKELDPYSEEALYEVIDFIKEENLNVLFLDTPQRRNKTEMGRANKVISILEQEGMKYKHFYDENSENQFTIDLDHATDFYNSGHVNYYGAVKFTKAFGEYLDQNYDLPDRRKDENAKKDWAGVQQKLEAKISDIEKKKSKN